MESETVSNGREAVARDERDWIRSWVGKDALAQSPC